MPTDDEIADSIKFWREGGMPEQDTDSAGHMNPLRLDIGDKIELNRFRLPDREERGWNIAVLIEFGVPQEFRVVGTRKIPCRDSDPKFMFSGNSMAGYFYLYECKRDIYSNKVYLASPEDVKPISKAGRNNE